MRHLPLILCFFLFSAFLMGHTFGYRDGNFTIASKLWSDFGAHIPLIRSFSQGFNFPPEYPTFPGEPIKYHFLFYLLVGLLEKTGLNLAFALNLVSTIGFGLMLTLLYLYAGIFSPKKRIGLLAVLLVLFNGSLSFLSFFSKFPPNLHTLKQILDNQHFVSFGPWDGQIVSAFWTLNIYTNQRHLGLSFALGLLLLYPLISFLNHHRPPSRFFWFLIPFLFLIMPWLHQAVLAMVVIIATIIFLSNWSKARSLLPLYLVGLAVSLPGLIFWRYAETPLPVPEIGFLAPDKSLFGIVIYWFYNLGLYLPLIPILFVYMTKKRRLIFTAFFSLFIIANTYRLSTDMINNHKLINFFQLYLSLETALFLHMLSQQLTGKILAGFLFVGLTFSGIIDFFPILNDRMGLSPDYPNHSTAAWILNHTPPQSRFLTTTYFYHPASLAGRYLFLDYGYFNWSLGYTETNRRHFVQSFFDQTLTDSAACNQLNHYGLNYLVLSPGKGEVSTLDPHDLPLLKQTNPIYSSLDGYTIYSVKTLCP